MLEKKHYHSHFKKRSLRIIDVKQLTQDHSARNWESKDSNRFANYKTVFLLLFSSGVSLGLNLGTRDQSEAGHAIHRYSFSNLRCRISFSYINPNFPTGDSISSSLVLWFAWGWPLPLTPEIIISHRPAPSSCAPSPWSQRLIQG